MNKTTKDMYEEILGHRLTKEALKVEATWSNYKGIHEAFERFQHVQEVFQNTWNKWSSRLNILREIQANEKEDLGAPSNLPNIIRGIEMIGEIIGFHERIGGQQKGKIKAFRDMEEQGVPKILNEDGTLKEYAPWRDFFRHQTDIGSQRTYIDDKLDLVVLNGLIDNLIRIQIDMDTFVKETRVVIDKRYNAYNTKVQKLLDINQPIEDEYKDWLDKYIEYAIEMARLIQSMVEYNIGLAFEINI